MKKYFKIIGILELISFVCGYIGLIIYVFMSFYLLPILVKILVIIGLLFALFVGPAMGLLFIYFSNSMDNDKNNSDILIHELKVNNSNDNKSNVSYRKICDENKKISEGDRVIVIEDNGCFKKNTIGKVSVISKDKKEILVYVNSDLNGFIPIEYLRKVI